MGGTADKKGDCGQRGYYATLQLPRPAQPHKLRHKRALSRGAARATRGGDAQLAHRLARCSRDQLCRRFAMLALTWLKQRVRGLHGVPESDAESDAQCDATLSGRHTDRVRTVPHILVQAVQVGVGMCITTLRRLSFRSAATDLSQALL